MGKRNHVAGHWRPEAEGWRAKSREVTIPVPAFRVSLPVNELVPTAEAFITHPDLGTLRLTVPMARNSNDSDFTAADEDAVIASMRVAYCKAVADRMVRR